MEILKIYIEESLLVKYCDRVFIMHKHAWYLWCIYDAMVYECFDKKSAGCAVTCASKSAIKSEMMHSRQLA